MVFSRLSNLLLVTGLLLLLRLLVHEALALHHCVLGLVDVYVKRCLCACVWVVVGV